MPEDLWPNEFGNLDVPPPIQTLKEQADNISKKTAGRIVGQVLTSRHSEGFAHDFFLLAPFLDDYTYRLFMVTHSVQLYPLTIHADVVNQVYQCDSPKDFQERLRTIFAAEETKRVVSALLAQTDALKV